MNFKCSMWGTCQLAVVVTTQLNCRITRLRSLTSGCRGGLPPIMRATAPNVARSCCLCMSDRSRTMVHTNVKRRRAMNIGTFRSAVPAKPCTRLEDQQEVLRGSAAVWRRSSACTMHMKWLVLASPTNPNTTFNMLTTAKGKTAFAVAHSSRGFATI